MRGVEALNQSASFLPPLYRTAREAMPTTSFKVDGKPQSPVSDLFVVGRVASIDEGRSFSWPNGPQVQGGPATQEEHPFNAPKSQISTISMQVDVERSIAGEPGLPQLKTVRIGLSLPSPVDMNSVRAEFPAGRRIAAILVANAKTPFVEDPNWFGVLGYGEMLGFVDEGGTVTFPAWSDGRDASGQMATTSLEELVTPVNGPVEIRMIDGRPSRTGE